MLPAGNREKNREQLEKVRIFRYLIWQSASTMRLTSRSGQRYDPHLQIPSGQLEGDRQGSAGDCSEKYPQTVSR